MVDHKFEKSYRLLTAKDFQYLRNGSRSIRSKYLKVYYKSGDKNRLLRDNNSRLGLAVTKKVGNACIRALSKRIIRETFRQSAYKNCSLDLVVTVSPSLFKNNSKKDAVHMLRTSFLASLAEISNKRN